MKIVKNDIEYTLPVDSALAGMSLKKRKSSISKAYSHGGIATGDGKIDTRKIEIDVDIWGANEADYFDKKNSLLGALNLSGYRLYFTKSKYFNIDTLESDTESFYPGRYLRHAKIKATLLAIDPFIYEETGLIFTGAVSSAPTTFFVNNPGNIDTPAIITVTAAAAATEITITNVTDSNRLMTYNDPQMIAGVVLTVDAVAGTVKRGAANTLNNFGGTFLRLLPGNNEITYTGGPCTLQISAGRRWL